MYVGILFLWLAMYLASGLVPGPRLGPGLGLEKVPVFGPNRPSRCPGCQALEFRWVRPECLIQGRSKGCVSGGAETDWGPPCY